MATVELSYLLSEIVVCEDSYAGKCQSLGDVEAGGVSILGSGRKRKRMGMITPVRFCGDC